MLENNPIGGKLDKHIIKGILELIESNVLSDPTAPQNFRAYILATSELRGLFDKLCDFHHASIAPMSENEDYKSIQKVNKAAEYIRLMRIGLDSFIEAWEHE